MSVSALEKLIESSVRDVMEGAEMVAARVENKRPNLEWAYKRSVRMIVGRLRGYGLKWRTWVSKNRFTTRVSVIPEKHKDKEILEQSANGEYRIHPVLWQAAQA